MLTHIFILAATSYLEWLLRFFLTMTTITMNNIKLMTTTAITIPAIIGSEDELEDESVGVDDITIRISYMLFTVS